MMVPLLAVPPADAVVGTLSLARSLFAVIIDYTYVHTNHNKLILLYGTPYIYIYIVIGSTGPSSQLPCRPSDMSPGCRLCHTADIICAAGQ